jgi:hypothetical protein
MINNFIITQNDTLLKKKISDKLNYFQLVVLHLLDFHIIFDTYVVIYVISFFHK